MMWTEGQAVVRVIGGAVVDRGEVEITYPDGWGFAFGSWWRPDGLTAGERLTGGQWGYAFGRVYDAAEWDAAEVQREQATRERIGETAARAEVRRRINAALAELPPERLAVLADELEREARGER